jgi:hypothetical protein
MRVLLSFGGALLNYPVDTNSTISRPVSFVVTGVLLCLGTYSVFTIRKQFFRNWEAPELVAFTWFVGPIAAAFVASYIFFPIFSLRFMIVASAGCYLLASLGLDALPSTSVRILLVGFLVVGLVTSLTVYYDTETTEQWDQATAYIESRADPGAPVFVVPSHANMSVEYYLGNTYRIKGISPEGDPLEVTPGETVWLVSRYPDQAEWAVAALNDTHTEGEHRSFGSVQVCRMDARGEEYNNATAGESAVMSTVGR